MRTLPGLPDMVLDPGPRGLDAGALDTAGAFRAPQLRIDGVLDEARGTAALGGAVQQAGGALHELGVKALEAKSMSQQLDAQNLIIEGEGELSSLLAAEQDPSKWGDVTEKHIDRLRGSVGKVEMMAGAREAVNAKLARWEASTRSNIKKLAAEETIKQTAGKLRLQRERAVLRRDRGAFKSALDAEMQLGTLPGEAADVEWLKAEEKWKQQDEHDEISRVEVEAAATPRLFLERNQEAEEDPFKERVRQAGTSAAHRQIRLDSSNATSEIADGIVTGAIKSEADVERVAGGRLSPAQVEDQKALFAKWADDKWRAQNSTQEAIARNLGRLVAEARNFKGDRYSDAALQEYSRIKGETELLIPEGRRHLITKILDGKYYGEPPQANKRVKEFADSVMSDWFEEGKFGKFKEVRELTPTDEGYPGYGGKTASVTDRAAKAAAQEKFGNAQMALDDFFEANPDATIEQTREFILKQTGAAIAPSEVDSLLRRPAPAPAEAPDWQRLRSSYDSATPEERKALDKQRADALQIPPFTPDGPSNSLLPDMPVE